MRLLQALAVAALMVCAGNASAYIQHDLLLDTWNSDMAEGSIGPSTNPNVEITTGFNNNSYNRLRYRPDSGSLQVAPIRVSELTMFSLDLCNLGSTWAGKPRIELFIDPSDTGFRTPRVWASYLPQTVFDPLGTGQNLGVWLNTGNMVDASSARKCWEVTQEGGISAPGLTWSQARDLLISLEGDRIIDTFYISFDVGRPFAQDNWTINNDRWSVADPDLPPDPPGPEPARNPEPATLFLFGIAGAALLRRR